MSGICYYIKKVLSLFSNIKSYKSDTKKSKNRKSAGHKSSVSLKIKLTHERQTVSNGIINSVKFSSSQCDLHASSCTNKMKLESRSISWSQKLTAKRKVFTVAEVGTVWHRFKDAGYKVKICYGVPFHDIASRRKTHCRTTRNRSESHFLLRGRELGWHPRC